MCKSPMDIKAIDTIRIPFGFFVYLNLFGINVKITCFPYECCSDLSQAPAHPHTGVFWLSDLRLIHENSCAEALSFEIKKNHPSVIVKFSSVIFRRRQK